MSSNSYTLGRVQFADADNNALFSNFILILTLAIIFYVALFVKEPEQAEEEHTLPAKSVIEAKTQGFVCVCSCPSSQFSFVTEISELSDETNEGSNTNGTPKKSTPKKKVDLGHVTSPDGRRTSIRLRAKTPAK